MKIYPTIDEIKKMSGEDMIVNTGNELKANTEIKQYVDFFYRILSQENTNKTFNEMAELIKNNPIWQGEFKNIIATFIYEDYNLEKERKEIVLELINGSPLFKVKRLWLR